MLRVLTFLVILSLGLCSCKKDPTDPAGCATNWAEEVQAEITDLSNAAAAYGTNPTTATCSAYKAAYQDYVDALKPFLKCSTWTAQQKADLQDAIDEAEGELETLCDE